MASLQRFTPLAHGAAVQKLPPATINSSPMTPTNWPPSGWGRGGRSRHPDWAARSAGIASKSIRSMAWTCGWTPQPSDRAVGPRPLSVSIIITARRRRVKHSRIGCYNPVETSQICKSLNPVNTGYSRTTRRRLPRCRECSSIWSATGWTRCAATARSSMSGTRRRSAWPAHRSTRPSRAYPSRPFAIRTTARTTCGASRKRNWPRCCRSKWSCVRASSSDTGTYR